MACSLSAADDALRWLAVKRCEHRELLAALGDASKIDHGNTSYSDWGKWSWEVRAPGQATTAERMESYSRTAGSTETPEWPKSRSMEKDCPCGRLPAKIRETNHQHEGIVVDAATPVAHRFQLFGRKFDVQVIPSDATLADKYAGHGCDEILSIAARLSKLR